MATEEHRYKVHSISYSIIDEGALAGMAAVFVRFAGWGLRCTEDAFTFGRNTDYMSCAEMTASDILADALRKSTQLRWVVFTGSEPMLSLDAELLTRFGRMGWSVCVQTSGLIALRSRLHLVDWLIISPKTSEALLQQWTADEVRYVLSNGDPLPQTTIHRRPSRLLHRLLQPASDGLDPNQANVDHCVKLVKENSGWRLSAPMHMGAGRSKPDPR